MAESSPDPRLHETTVPDIRSGWPGHPAGTIFSPSGDHAFPLSGDHDGPLTAQDVRYLLLSHPFGFPDPVHAWIPPVRPAGRLRGGDQGELHLHPRQIREVAGTLLRNRQLSAGLLH